MLFHSRLPAPALPVWLRRNLLAALALSALAGAPLHAAPPPWLKLETPEFVVYSDAPEKQVVECALRYAAFRRAFAELFLATGHTLPPSSLLLFRTDKAFRAVTPPSTEKNTTLVNFSCEVDATPLNAFALAGDRDRALEMTFEFETVWALRRIGHFVPVWMSQGAGEVLSSVKLEKDRCLLGEEMRHNFSEAFDWPRFFEISESSKRYREGGSDLANYLDQAWGLMHWFLLSEGDSRDRFEALELQLRAHPAIEAVPAVMHTPVEQLTKAIRRHPKKARAISFDAAALRASFHLTPAPKAEVLVQTANLLGANQRFFEANAQLDEARSLAPDLPVVKEAWARRMLLDGRAREAIQLYREAIEAGSRNYVAYLKSATTRLNDNMTYGSDRAGDGGPEAVKAVGELRRAVQLNPFSLECYSALGRALYVSPKFTAGQIEELAPGITTGPEGQLVRFYRALLYSRLHRREECARDFRDILADPDLSEPFRHSAGQQYVQEIIATDAQQVEKCVRDRDYAPAFEIVAVGEKDPEAQIVEGYHRLRRWLINAVRSDPDATAAERKLAGLE